MATLMTTSSELAAKQLQQPPCLLCGGERFREVFKGVVINSHLLGECLGCGMVQALPQLTVSAFDYSGYGDYLLLNDREIAKRVRWVSGQMAGAFRTIKKRFTEPVVVDFGSGAGYLCKAAQNYGFQAIGIELSDKLTEFFKTRFGFENVVKRIEDLDCKCDAILMSDVIEHLPPVPSRHIMTELLEHLNPCGILVGNNTNIKY